MDRRERSFSDRKYSKARGTITLTIVDEETEDELEVEFPAKFEVCGTCDGKGSHVNPSIDSEGISAEDFAEDPDFEESYFAGHYDQTCNECDGLRVVPQVDEEKLSEPQKVQFKSWLSAEQYRYDYESERAHERRMGY